jgi:lipopolysaccharide/colanic/teichoic acid biosynthesis glycosyltransferase
MTQVGLAQRRASLTLKRVFDIAVSLGAIALLWPFILIIGLLVAARFGRPVFFTQVRPGRHGKPFRIVKFRTMTNDRDAAGSLLPDAARLPPFGRFLRATSLDELPELLNVLRGEMSLVGPRPLLMEYLSLYTPEQSRRHEVRPGLTGWAQVNGRNNLPWAERFSMDVWYVDNRSFWLDLKILVMTLFNIVRSRDISQEGHATMERFRGGK